MDIGNDIDIAYYNGIGAEVVEEGILCYLSQVVYGLSIPLTIFQKGPNIKVVADTSSLLDVVSREGNIMNKILGELGIHREKRLNSEDEKVQKAHQNRAMTTSGSAYGDVMEIPAFVVGTSSSLVRRPSLIKTVPPSEQTNIVQIPPAGTEGVDADGVNLEAVEQNALDLAKRDPIRLDTQIRSSILQLSVAWKSAAEVLKLVATDRDELVRQYDTKKAALREQLEKEKVLQRGKFEKEKALQKDQFEKEAAAAKKKVENDAKKAIDIMVASQNNLIQAFYFWGLSRGDVNLALTGKYSEITFPGDDASPVFKQILAPPVADDKTEEVAGANS
ncbi:hypothetical protein GIB67_025874 [Kingdonia uniflora]|uniref:Uncharacterized protein n=1 Tax=Kingdonia uniflora TaxID=39325 RepID=A0A7J7MD83_9MAGN|nr:hypothetical protein GIB67_025874 [Kingdonia uniflora]